MSNSIVQGLTSRPVDEGQENHVLNKEVIPVLKKVREIVNDEDTRRTVVSVSSDYTMAETDGVVVFTGSSAATITLPAADIEPEHAHARVLVNNGTGTATFAAPAGHTVNDAASFSLRQSEATIVFPDGATKWRTNTALLSATFQPLTTTTFADLTMASSTVKAVFDVVGRLLAAANLSNLVDSFMRLRYTINAQGHALTTSEIRGLRIQPTVTDAGGATHKPFSISDDDGLNPDLFAIVAGATRQLQTRLASMKLNNAGGFQLGTTAAELFALWGATPGAQPAAVADATGAGDVVAQLNALLARLRSRGFIAT